MALPSSIPIRDLPQEQREQELPVGGGPCYCVGEALGAGGLSAFPSKGTSGTYLPARCFVQCFKVV